MCSKDMIESNLVFFFNADAALQNQGRWTRAHPVPYCKMHQNLLRLFEINCNIFHKHSKIVEKKQMTTDLQVGVGMVGLVGSIPTKGP